ncbi:hypothetical protein [Paenibacillus agricola]|uniref:Uncharacterized protein n=1 Tax=Paenibacillus agricola TaxID=2716264 RepID=A0ABX0JF68_9BACL|nr:hypothetical protein [Paenibacillus agricola]NHN34802.1 hypothetical protein [Paenibacillus agricola]
MKQLNVTSMVFETEELKKDFIATLNGSKINKIFTIESNDIMYEKPEFMLSELKGQWYIYSSSEENLPIYPFSNLDEVIAYAQDTYKDNYLQVSWFIMENMLKRYSKLFLDTSVFTAILNKNIEEHVFIASKMLSLVEKGSVEAIASVISLSDILPLGKSEHEQAHLYLLMNKFKNLTWDPVDLETVKETTKHHSNYLGDFKTSLIIASAITTNKQIDGKIAFISIGEPNNRLVEIDHYAFYKS